MFDLFHVLLNGLLQILKRKLKEKHFCFIEKMIVQSVMLIIKKKKTTTTTTKTIHLIAILRKTNTPKKNLICWFADHFIQRIKSSNQPVHKPAVPFPSSFRSPLKEKNSYKGYKIINSSLKKLSEFLSIVTFDFDFVLSLHHQWTLSVVEWLITWQQMVKNRESSFWGRTLTSASDGLFNFWDHFGNGCWQQSLAWPF